VKKIKRNLRRKKKISARKERMKKMKKIMM
jgi:hypothetical protein